jgi:hypothetical protein
MLELCISSRKGAATVLHPLVIHIRDAIIAGSTGRMAMLLIIYGGPMLGLPRIDVVGILGSVAAPNKQDAATLGGAIHFTLGILFAMVYAFLWDLGIGQAIWWWGLIFGFVHGLVVLFLLQSFIRGFPLLIESSNNKQVMVAILLNHMIYGLIVALVYAS